VEQDPYIDSRSVLTPEQDPDRDSRSVLTHEISRHIHASDTGQAASSNDTPLPFHEPDQPREAAQPIITPAVSTAKNFYFANAQERHVLSKSGPKRIWDRICASVTDSWAPEVASVLLSMALLATLGVLLNHWDGKSTSMWTAQLSVPTIVVIVARASHASLSIAVASCLGQLGWMHYNKKRALIDLQRYDAASRGPWGALRLLFSAGIAGRKITLAFFVLTAGLGFAASAQQCLQVRGPTAIPVLNHLTEIDNTAGNTAILPDGLRSAAVRSLSAKYSSVNRISQIPLIELEPGSPARTQLVPPGTIDYRCGTANCSPRPYATLSLCLSCDDISDQLQAEGDTQTPRKSTTSDGSISTTFGDDDAYVILPDGTWADRKRSLRLRSRRIDQYDQSSGNEVHLANFSLIQSVTYLAEGSSQLDNVQGGFTALRCIVKACANIYHLDVSSGTARNEDLLASITHFVGGEFSSDGRRYGGETVLGFSASNKTMRYPDGRNSQWEGQPDWASVSTSSRGIDVASRDYLSGFFESLFNGTSNQTWQRSISGGPVTPDTLGFAQQPNGVGFWNSLEFLFSAYHFRDGNDASHQIEGALRNIVTSMANFLRDWGFAVAAGSGMEYANVYRGPATNEFFIQWAWFGVPVAVELFAMVLLLWTMKVNRDMKVPVWKTSMLPIMLRGVVDDGPPEQSVKVSEMETWAETKCVQLAKDSSPYRLLTVTEESARLAQGTSYMAEGAIVVEGVEQDPLVSRVRRRWF
jgi:hypothetical protein